MAQPSTMRLAQVVLRENRHLITFDIDPLEHKAADLLTTALEAFGCTVQRKLFSSCLTVTCPDPDSN
jgi:predicted O-methyltransferase YrrM